MYGKENIILGLVIQLYQNKEKINALVTIAFLRYNQTYELFAEVLTNKVTNILDETQSREHAGYRSDYLTIDHLQTIDQKQNVTNHFDSY